ANEATTRHRDRRLHQGPSGPEAMTASTRLLVRGGTAAALASIGYVLVQRARRWDLRGRTVLVTGGSRGLGLSIARELARVGARVAICGRDEATLDRARCELERHGLVIALRCDMRVKDDIDALVNEV